MTLTQEEEKRFEELGRMAFDYARNNRCKDLEIMIKAGLNPNLKTHKGDSLLMLASYNNSLETAQMLLKNGARVDEQNDRGQTPLAGVCFKGYLPMCKLLVENGANIDKDNGLGMTPYGFAIMFGRREVAEFLLQHSKKSFLKLSALKVLKFLTFESSIKKIPKTLDSLHQKN